MTKVIFFIGVLVSILVVNPAFAQNPVNYFLGIREMPGESRDDKHQNWIDLTSVSEGVSAMGTTGGRGAAGAIRAQFSPLAVVKRVDKASVNLRIYCATGKIIPTVILACAFKSETFPLDFYTVKLTNAIVTSVRFGAGKDGPSEEVAFNYEAIEWNYRPLGPGGKSLPDITHAFDLIKNQVIK